MAPENISMWSMYGAWAGALSTFLAVLVALYLPKSQLKQAGKEAEKNAYKLVTAQLLIVQNDISSHLAALGIPSILNSPIKEITYLSHDVLSAIDVSKLTLLYKFMHGIDLTNKTRESAFYLIDKPKDAKFQMYALAYKDGVNSLQKKAEELFVAFES